MVLFIHGILGASEPNRQKGLSLIIFCGRCTSFQPIMFSLSGVRVESDIIFFQYFLKTTPFECFLVSHYFQNLVFANYAIKKANREIEY